jgi:hypothetical protein
MPEARPAAPVPALPRWSRPTTWLAPLWVASLAIALFVLPPVFQLVLQGTWIVVFIRLHEKRLTWASVVALTVLGGYFLVTGLILGG